MFTGIIEALAFVEKFQKKDRSDYQLVVSTNSKIFTKDPVQLGESIALNGACLTVEKILKPGTFSFSLSSETIARTNFVAVKKGSLLNLERAMLLTTRLSGHWVQGHIDGVATIEKIKKQGTKKDACFEVTIKLPKALTKYCVEKGSITVDGISLTINKIKKSKVHLMIIPHTWEYTNLKQRMSGDQCNIEVDILAKYVQKLLA